MYGDIFLWHFIWHIRNLLGQFFHSMFWRKMSSFEQSPEQRRILIEKAQRRAVLRAEFLKQTSNPFVHGEGGAVVSETILIQWNITQSLQFRLSVVLCHRLENLCGVWKGDFVPLRWKMFLMFVNWDRLSYFICWLSVLFNGWLFVQWLMTLSFLVKNCLWCDKINTIRCADRLTLNFDPQFSLSTVTSSNQDFHSLIRILNRRFP